MMFDNRRSFLRLSYRTRRKNINVLLKMEKALQTFFYLYTVAYALLFMLYRYNLFYNYFIYILRTKNNQVLFPLKVYI